MNKSLQDAIINAKQDPNGLSDADLEFIYQQGKEDAEKEKCKGCIIPQGVIDKKVNDAIEEVIKITWEFAEEINTFETYRNEVLREMEQKDEL